MSAALTLAVALSLSPASSAPQPAGPVSTADVPLGVVYHTNELLQRFAKLRVVRYEDTDAVSDFGLVETRVVRLAAVKP